MCILNKMGAYAHFINKAIFPFNECLYTVSEWRRNHVEEPWLHANGDYFWTTLLTDGLCSILVGCKNDFEKHKK